MTDSHDQPPRDDAMSDDQATDSNDPYPADGVPDAATARLATPPGRPHWALGDRALQRARAAAQQTMDLTAQATAQTSRTAPTPSDIEAAARALDPGLAARYDAITDAQPQADTPNDADPRATTEAWLALLDRLRSTEEQRLIEPSDRELDAGATAAQELFADLTAELGVRAAQSPAERRAEARSRRDLASRERRVLDAFELGIEERQADLSLAAPAPTGVTEPLRISM